jgi:hypothetical protein
MTKEEVLQALRLTAMGRVGHPLQEQLGEELAVLLDSSTIVARREAEVEAEIGRIRSEKARMASFSGEAVRPRKAKAD